MEHLMITQLGQRIANAKITWQSECKQVKLLRSQLSQGLDKNKQYLSKLSLQGITFIPGKQVVTTLSFLEKRLKAKAPNKHHSEATAKFS